MKGVIGNILDYLFLVIGIYFLISLFFPPLILWTRDYIDLGAHAESILANLFWIIPIAIVLAMSFHIFRYFFIKDAALGIYTFMLNVFHSLLICSVFIVGLFLLMPVFQMLILPPLFWDDMGLAMIALFLGVFYTLSSIRDLNERDHVVSRRVIEKPKES